jgi:hypothetical protein
MAKDIVEQRAEHYGDPKPNMERTAALWSAYLGHEVTAHDVSVCMMLVKISRAKVSAHDDNYVDIRGYADIAQALR